MKKVLLYVNYPEENMDTLVGAFSAREYEVIQVCPGTTEAEKQALIALDEADVAILGAGLPIAAIENAKKLRWVHFDWVGIEGSISEKMFERGIIVTNGSGRNSICLAEHVFYFIFTLTYDSRAIFKAQNECSWKVVRSRPYVSLFSRKMLIVGTGSIGQAVAARAKAFGMETIGFARSGKKGLEMFDRIFAAEDGYSLADLVSDVDFLVLATSLNESSFHMVNSSIFGKMKKTAYVINICRGAVIDENALVEALESGLIAGAGCDTFEKEPLPADSRLWKLDNMVVTPHSTPQSPLKFIDGVRTVTDNLELFENNEPLRNRQTENDLLRRR